MSDEFKPKDITIPAPRRSTVPRGKYSSAKQAPTRSIRIPDEEYEALMTAARRCDMTWAEFMRWCTTYAAIDVNKQFKLHGFK